MCGIAGFFNWDARAPVPYGGLRRAAHCLALRGPDAGGFHDVRGVGLVHRRLTVIDPVGGWQPMVDRETRVCLTYNGEIYNFKALRTELSALGHFFESDSDTEVLLHAYLQWGRDCLDRLVGIFAFGIYDPRNEQLLLARDRMGAKPLYYAETADGLAFASSVAALRALGAAGSGIDREALLHYFSSIRTTMGGQTLLRDVKTLEPGMALTARRSRRSFDCFRYWEFPVVSAADKVAPPMDEAAQIVRALVQEAVESQMVSDVPLGGFLSGGVDSTVIAKVASELGDFGAYNVGYGEQGCNEWPHVRMAAKAYGIDCKEIHLGSEGFVDTWMFLMEQKGLPLSTPNEVPIYHLAKALRQEYTVALSGEGADEVFGGYVTPYFSAFDFDRARRVPLAGGETFGSIDLAMMRLYGQSSLSGHVEHHFLLNSWVSPPMLQTMLDPQLAGGFSGVRAFYGDLFRRFDGCSTLDKHMHLHARINLEGLLNRVDSSTMAASVEARVPFTDHRIAEYLYALPDEYRLGWRNEAARLQGRFMNVVEIDQQNLLESKVLLRRAFHADVPREIMQRRKVSFPVPFREWLGGTLRSFAGDVLGNSDLIGGIVRDSVLREVMAGADNPAYGMLLWPLVNLALWEKTCLHPSAMPLVESWEGAGAVREAVTAG